jgi:hypothetical protein
VRQKVLTGGCAPCLLWRIMPQKVERLKMTARLAEEKGRLFRGTILLTGLAMLWRGLCRLRTWCADCAELWANQTSAPAHQLSILYGAAPNQCDRDLVRRDAVTRIEATFRDCNQSACVAGWDVLFTCCRCGEAGAAGRNFLGAIDKAQDSRRIQRGW